MEVKENEEYESTQDCKDNKSEEDCHNIMLKLNNRYQSKTESVHTNTRLFQHLMEVQTNKIVFARIQDELKSIVFRLKLRSLDLNSLVDLYNKYIYGKLRLVSSMLVMDLTKKEFQNLFAILQDAVLPQMSLISLWNVSSLSIDSINNFLQNCLPQKLLAFSFNNLSNTITSINPYYESLRKAAKKCTQELQLHNLKMSGQEFCGLIESASHCEKIHICRCCIEADEECKISIPNMPSLKTIVLSFWNLDNNWTVNNKRFKNIISGILKSKSLKHLQKIQIEGSETDINRLKKSIEYRDISRIRFESY